MPAGHQQAVPVVVLPRPEQDHPMRELPDEFLRGERVQGDKFTAKKTARLVHSLFPALSRACYRRSVSAAGSSARRGCSPPSWVKGSGSVSSSPGETGLAIRRPPNRDRK